MAFDPTIAVKKYKIVIDHTKIDSELTNFPVTINLGANSIPAVSDLGDSGKLKMAVTDASDTQLPIELSLWDTTNGIGVIHVKVPTVSDTEDTILTLAYDSSQDDNTTYVGEVGSTVGKSVWDSDFVDVFHFNTLPSQGVTSCVRSLTLTKNSSMADSLLNEGALGKVIDFDGVDDYMATPATDFSALGTDFTVESFLSPHNPISNWAPLLVIGPGNGGNISPGVGSDSTKWHNALWGGTTETTLTCLRDTYQYMAQYRTGGATKVFVDDVVDSSSDTSNVNVSGSLVLLMCCAPDESKHFGAKYAELRISKVARSNAWLKATNYTLKGELLTAWEVVSSRVVDFDGFTAYSIGTNLLDVDWTRTLSSDTQITVTADGANITHADTSGENFLNVIFGNIDITDSKFELSFKIRTDVPNNTNTHFGVFLCRESDTGYDSLADLYLADGNPSFGVNGSEVYSVPMPTVGQVYQCSIFVDNNAVESSIVFQYGNTTYTHTVSGYICTSPINRISLYNNENGDWTLLDYVVRAGTDISPLGNYEIKPITPENTSVAGFTPSQDTNKDCIATHDDSKYNRGEAGDEDSYTMSDVTSSLVPAAVLMHYRAKEGSVSGVDVQAIVNDTVVGTLEVDSDFQEFTVMLEENPATDTAWTLNDVNQMTAGYKGV